MTFGSKVLGLAVVGSLLAGPGCQRPPQKTPTVAEATVNDEKIMAPEFDSAMRLVCGPLVLQRLVEHRVIWQEAKKQNLTLEDGELKEFVEALDKQTTQPEMKKVLENELRARLLSRKLILKDVSDAKKHEVYDHFKDDLVQYELFDILVANREEADNVVTSLKQGTKFDSLAVSSSFDQRSKLEGGRLGFLTLPTIKDTFGTEVAEAVGALKQGQVSSPIAAEGGVFLILKLGKTRSSYEDLKTSVEDVLVEAGRATLMYRLLSSAHITSPYLPTTPVGPQPPVGQPSVDIPKAPRIPLPQDNPNPIPQETPLQIPINPPTPIPRN